MKDREAKYWRAEYENLRRKTNKQIEDLKYKQARFSHKTYDLLESLGLSFNEIVNYYKEDDRTN